MLIGSLLRFSSNKDDIKDSHDGSDDLMNRSLSNKAAAAGDQSLSQVESPVDPENISLDELAEISRSLLMDENLEVSKVRPFFWTLVETYVDRFQIFPFDAVKALFSYLEIHDYPEAEIRDLVKRLEKRYKKQHGKPIQKSGNSPVSNGAGEPTLDEEIKDLRETLKYAAIVGERIDDKE